MAKTYNQIKKSVLGNNYDVNYNNKNDDKTEKTYSEIKAGVMNGEYDFSHIKSDLENTIRFDSFESDLASMGKTIEATYNGWQTPETMKNTLASIESMQGRLKAYKEYQKLFGGADLSELYNNYGKVVDGWNDLTELYGRYQNADAYKTETEVLGKLGKMTSKDIEPYLNDKSGSPTFGTPKNNEVSDLYGDLDATIAYYTDDGQPVTLGEFNEQKRQMAGQSKNAPSIAYTTVDGQNITWQSLYDQKKKREDHDALYKEVTTNANYEKYREIGANAENPSYEKVESSNFGPFYFGPDVQNPVKYSIENKDYLGMAAMNGSTSQYGDLYYTEINDEELGIYNSYLGQELEGVVEKGTAEKYLKSIYETLKDRYENRLVGAMASYADEHPVIASALSVGQSLASGVEYLKDTGNYLITGELDDNHLAKASSTVRDTVSQKVDWKIGNWDAFDFVYNTGMSMADSAVAMTTLGGGGGVALGLSAAAQGTNDALERGLDNRGAFWNGLTSGVFEGLFETYSIGKMKAFKDAPVDGVKSIIKNLGKSMLTNASEETLTELANVTYDMIANGDLSQAKTDIRTYVNSGMSESEAKRKVALEQAGRVLESGASGALMGLGFGGVHQTQAYSRTSSTGKSIKANERVGDMISLVDGLTPEESEAYNAYTRYANKGVTADDISNAQLGNLHSLATSDAMKVMKSKTSTEEQKQSAENTLRDLAAFTQESSTSQVRAEDYDEESVQEMVEQALELDEDTLSYKLATKYKAKLDNGKKLSSKEITKLVEANDAIFRPEAMSDVEEQLTELGETGDVAKIADAIIKEQSGEILTTAEVDLIKNSKYGEYVANGLTSEEIIEAEEALGNSARVMSKEEARLFNELYDDTIDIEDYRTSFNLVAQYAKDGYSQDTILKNKGVLTEAQVGQIYSATIKANIQAQEDKLAQIHAKMGKGMSYKGFIDDSVIDYKNKGTEGKVNWSSLKPKQRQAITFIKGIAKATGMNLKLVTDGRKKGFNGAFKVQSNTIVLDIYAGIDKAGKLADTLVPTFSHELTHWMKDKSPLLYRKLDEFIFKSLAEKDGISEEERVNTEITKLKNALRKEISAEEARDEIIARACEDMLAMSEEGKKLFNSLSESEQKTLIDKVKDIIAKLKDWITKLLSTYSSRSSEATLLREYESALNEMSKMWDEMLADATKNNQALELSGEYGHNATTIGARDLTDLSAAKGVDGKTLFQYRAIVEDEDIYREMLLKHKDVIGITNKQINDLFNMIDKAVDVISNNLEVLDYAWEADINDRAFVPIKPNSDSLYKVSLDFSTLCRKRLLQQTIQATLQETLNKQLSKEEAIAIRDELIKIQEEGRQIEVACALCYVESARMKSPAQITKFLNNREAIIREFFANRSGGSIKEKIKNAEMKARNNLKEANPQGLIGKNGVVLDALTAPKNAMLKVDADYIRAEGKKAKTSYKLTSHEQTELDAALRFGVDEFTSAKGLENLAKHHRDLFDAYTSFVRNATHSKGIENDTWWRAGDSANIGDSLIAQMNAENGLRSQSWSDFQVIHLLDYIAATIELSTKGAKRQSYTKVTDYVKLLGNTGDMINMSVIPEKEFSGKLGYDAVEGMPYTDAKKLRDQYHETAGIICIGIDDAQIRMLLADDTIDMVIPYHHSGMSKDTRKLMHIPTWITYEKSQNETALTDAEAQTRAKEYGVELKMDSKYQKTPKFSEWFNLEEARQIAKMENANPSDTKAHKKYGKMYGAYKAMQNAADNYLKLCAERGLAPKFSQFTTEDNYWKLLTDRKMVDNVTGEIIEQKPIKPIFNEKHILEILNDELARYPQVKADQEYATRKVVEKFLSGEMKVDDSTLEAIRNTVDNVTEVNILESADTKFSLRDSDYMDAVNKGDMETAQKMVDEAAEAAGYTVKGYHGTGADFNIFTEEKIGGRNVWGKGFYFGTSKGIADDYASWRESKGGKYRIVSANLKMTNPFMPHKSNLGTAAQILDRWFSDMWQNSRDLGIGYIGGKLENSTLDLLQFIAEHNKIEVRDVLREYGFDSVKDGGELVVFDSNQIKSADTVTYDDDGNVIPLSERFNESNNDIRYSLRDSDGNNLTEAQARNYSYDELIRKQHMEIRTLPTVTISEVLKYEKDHILFAKDMRDIARKQENEKNTPHNTYLYCEDLSADILITRDSFKHGAQKIDNTYISVCKQLADVLASSVVVNELAERDKTNGSYVLLGLAENKDSYVVIRSIVNKKTWKLQEFNELYAIKKTSIKKEDVGVKAPALPSKKGYGTSSVISVADFLKFVNSQNLSNTVLSMDVINHLNSARTFDKNISPSLQYSLREDDLPSVHELMGEAERLKKENEKLKKDFEDLQERLKIERQVTHGNYFNEKQLGAAAGHLRNISRSLYPKLELMKRMKDVYSYIAHTGEYADADGPVFDVMFDKCYAIAVDVLNDAKPEVEVDDYIKSALKDIRGRRISLSETQIEEAKYRFGNNYQRMFFGNVILAKDGIPLDNVWGELSSLYPAWFKEDITEGDQIGALYDAIEEMKAASEMVVEYNADEQARWLAMEIYNQYWNVSNIKTTADKYDKQIKRLNFDHRNRIQILREDYNARLKEQELELRWLAAKDKHELLTDMDKKLKEQHEIAKAKYQKLAEKIREERDKKIAEAKEHGKERLAQYRENSERKTYIQRITQNALTLNEWLVKNSKDKHIHESLKGPAVALLNAIDFSSKKLLDKGIPTKKDISLSQALNKVQKMMAKASVGHEELVELYGHGLDEDIEALIDSVDNIMRDVGDNELILNKMTLTDLQTLDKMVRTIKHSVSKMNKFHIVQHAKGIVNLSQESMVYLDSLGKEKAYDGLRGATKKLLNWNNSLPYYVFKRYGSGGMKIYEALQDGWDKFAFNTKAIIDYAEKAYTSKEVKAWSETVKSFKIAVPASPSDLKNPDYRPQYQTIEMTIPQIMSLYCLQKREQAKGHILGGGIRVADFKDAKGNIISQSDGVVLTANDIATLISSLTDKQKTVADKLQRFMNTTCTDWGNEVSMLRFGYKAFGEENYFPIQSDKNNLAVNDETEQPNSLFRLLNMSFTKSTIDKANNRVVISDIFDVFAQHTSDMAKYNALALPVLDAFKWYNYTEKQDIADGAFRTMGVKQSIESAFGKDGQNYFTTFLKDINGQQEVSRDTLGKHFFSNAKIAAVGANLRVMFLQPTSYVRASAVIDNKYLIKALGHKPKIKKAETHCGIALWKSMGYYDTNIQKGVEEQIKHNDTWRDKAAEWSMKGAEWGDKITWGYLWNACELEVRETRKDLKVGSKEFNEAIGKRLREVIYATQVVDSTMTRSQMMRGNGQYEKMLTAFASEPTLAYNMLQDAYMGLHLDTRRMGKKEAFKKNGKRIARVLTAYTLTNALAALVESGFDAFRDDDEEEKNLEYFMRLYLSNFLNDVSISAKIPYIKELHSVIRGFGSSRTDTQWMESFIYALKGWGKIFNGEGSATKTIKYSLKTVSDLLGLPFYSAYRDIMATFYNLEIFTADDLNEMFEDFFE